MSSIPIVSFGKICRQSELSETRDDWLMAAEQFGNALRSTGFVYLEDHGIPQSVIDAVFETSTFFFELPLETKKCYPRDMQKTFHGYTAVGKESFTRSHLSELRETFDTSVREPEHLPYPDHEVAEFRPAMKKLLQECEKVLKKMLKLLAITLELEDEDFFVNCHKNVGDPTVANYTQLRTLYYPSVPENVIPGSVRCAEHTDFGTFTLLFQDDLGGLEIKSTNGSWTPATPIPGCIIVNSGDLLNFWSGGSLPSTVHRVVIPEEEIKRKSPRQSIAYFAKPDNDTVIRALKSNRDEEEDMVIRPGEHFLKRTAFSIEAAPEKD